MSIQIRQAGSREGGFGIRPCLKPLHGSGYCIYSDYVEIMNMSQDLNYSLKKPECIVASWARHGRCRLQPRLKLFQLM